MVCTVRRTVCHSLHNSQDSEHPHWSARITVFSRHSLHDICLSYLQLNTSAVCSALPASLLMHQCWRHSCTAGRTVQNRSRGAEGAGGSIDEGRVCVLGVGVEGAGGAGFGGMFKQRFIHRWIIWGWMWSLCYWLVLYLLLSVNKHKMSKCFCTQKHSDKPGGFKVLPLRGIPAPSVTQKFYLQIYKEKYRVTGPSI